MRSTLRTEAARRTRARIQDLALAQLAEGGPSALSLKAIATSLDMSGPAIYRYYRSRDELLTDAVLDAYRDLGAAVAPAATVADFVAAYRAWALLQPHRYRLLYGPPLPGYDAHVAPLVEASQRVMNELLRCLADAPTPVVAGLDTAQVEAWVVARGVPERTSAAGAALVLWASVHGLVSLEINGDYASIGVDPAPLYDEVVRTTSRPG